jgi:hypothetical protein
MPDDEFPCLCIANGMAPAAHKRGERCPSWDMLLYGNAYGRVTERDDQGHPRRIEWTDPKDVIIKHPTVKRGNTMPIDPEVPWPTPPAPKDTVVKALVRNQLSPGKTIFGIFVAIGVALLVYGRVNQGDFWIAYAGWEISVFMSFWLTRAYRWAGGK